MGVSQQAFYSWKRRYAGLGINELRELRQLREENRKLKTLVADLTLDKHILQEVLSKRPEARGTPRAGMQGAAGISTQREASLRAGRNHSMDQSLPKSPRSPGGVANAITGPGRQPGSIWISTADGAAAKGGPAGERETGIPAVSGKKGCRCGQPNARNAQPTLGLR
jgi:putative transposase